MLQSDAHFTRIFDDLRFLYRHLVEKMLDGIERRYLVGRVDDGKYGNTDARWSETSIAHREGTSAKAVFTVEQLKDLAEQRARKRNLVESPSFNPDVDIQGGGVRDAMNGVSQSRPDECVGTGQRAYLR